MEIESTDQIFRSERNVGGGFDGGAAAALCTESNFLRGGRTAWEGLAQCGLSQRATPKTRALHITSVAP